MAGVEVPSWLSKEIADASRAAAPQLASGVVTGLENFTGGGDPRRVYPMTNMNDNSEARWRDAVRHVETYVPSSEGVLWAYFRSAILRPAEPSENEVENWNSEDALLLVYSVPDRLLRGWLIVGHSPSRVPLTQRCPTCLGNARLMCGDCDGSGYDHAPNYPDALLRAMGYRPCGRCSGSGRVTCATCWGRGQVEE